MSYFKINNVDYSMYVNKLVVDKRHVYTTRTNSKGTARVTPINVKHDLTVGIIPLDAAAMISLQRAMSEAVVTISYLSPETGLEETIQCLIANKTTEYYTIQDSKVKFNAFTLTLTEL